MDDFGKWFARSALNARAQVEGITDDTRGNEEIRLECRCGVYEYVSRSAFENGDTRWYSEDPDSGEGLCCGPFCLP